MAGFLTDGHPTTISIAGVVLKERTVTPPGMSMGGENDTTTMRNTAWRTRQPKKLKTLTNCSFTAAYDPSAYTTLLGQLGVNQEITVTLSNGDTITFWGWLDEFTPNEISEGAMPDAACTIIPSNQNNTGAEVAPVFQAAA